MKTPLTAFLTINWRSAPGFKGKDEASWSSHHTRVVKSMQRWLAVRSVPVVFAYVRERVVGRGSHTHFFVHIPSCRWEELTTALEEHLQDAGGFKEAGAVQIERRRMFTPGMTHLSQRLGVLQYVSKGINPAEMIHMPGVGYVPLSQFIGITPVPQATMPCKRVGCSTNTGPGAREKAGYVDTDDVLRLASNLPLK